MQMRIAVCFKLIMDFDQPAGANWGQTGYFRLKTTPAGADLVSKNFGFFDEGALETALRIKESDSSAELEAISLGTEDRLFTETLYAVGYDKVTYLQAVSDFDSQNTAAQLAAYIQDNKFDLILTGESVGPLDSGSVPYLMAHKLGCPVIDKLCDAVAEDGKIVMTRETDSSVETYNVAAGNASPVIAVVSNAKHPYLRLASYEKKKTAKSIPAKLQKASAGKWNVSFDMPKSKERKMELIGKERLAEILSADAQQQTTPSEQPLSNQSAFKQKGGDFL